MDIAHKIAREARALNNPAIAFAMSKGLTKDQAITACLVVMVEDCGLSVAEALDRMFGPGTFSALADEVWQILRAKR